jgi:glycogen(starch) synthase
VTPFRSPKLIVGHSCVISWWEAVKGGEPPPTWDRYRRAVRAGLDAADLVVAPTAWMLSMLDRHHGPLPPSCVIHNGRRADGLPRAKEPLILGAGRLWDEAKNLRLLARVAHRLPWPVAIAGAAAAEGIASDEFAPGDNTRLLGKLAQGPLAEAYASASIFVSTARYEPFGLTVLEAARSGCALVLGDLPSLRELWDGVAVFVPPDDEAALLRALRSLIDDPPVLAGLAARASRRGRALDADTMVGGYLSVYRTLMAGRAHPATQTEGSPCAS